MDLQLSTTAHAGYAVVQVAGEIDLVTAGALEEQARAAFGDVSRQVVLDLSRVDFMDSTGVKVLVAARHSAAQAGGSLGLAGVTPPVRKVLTVTGLERIFAIYDSVEAATSAPRSIAAAEQP